MMKPKDGNFRPVSNRLVFPQVSDLPCQPLSADLRSSRVVKLQNPLNAIMRMDQALPKPPKCQLKSQIPRPRFQIRQYSTRRQGIMASTDDSPEATFDYGKCQRYPFYDPYTLHPVLKKFAVGISGRYKGLYFTKTKSGVTMYNDGEATFTPLERWVEEKSKFNSIKRKRFFRFNRELTVFSAWKKRHRQRKLMYASSRVEKKHFLFDPVAGPCIKQIHDMMSSLRQKLVCVKPDLNGSSGRISLDKYVRSQNAIGCRHKTAFCSVLQNIKLIVLVACKTFYAVKNIPIEGHVHLIDISQRRNLQAILSKFIKLIEFNLQANILDTFRAREQAITSLFSAHSDSLQFRLKATVSMNDPIAVSTYPCLDTIQRKMVDSLDLFLEIGNEVKKFSEEEVFRNLLGLTRSGENLSVKFDVLLAEQDFEENQVYGTTLLPFETLSADEKILENRSANLDRLARMHDTLEEVFKVHVEGLIGITSDRNEILFTSVGELQKRLDLWDNHREQVRLIQKELIHGAFVVETDEMIQTLLDASEKKLGWLKNNLRGTFDKLTTSLVSELTHKRNELAKPTMSLAEVSVRNESVVFTNEKLFVYLEDLKTCQALWEIMKRLCIKIPSVAEVVVSDIQRELRALKLQLSLCKQNMVESESSIVESAETEVVLACNRVRDIQSKLDRQEVDLWAVADFEEMVQYLRKSIVELEMTETNVAICLRVMRSYDVVTDTSIHELVDQTKAQAQNLLLAVEHTLNNWSIIDKTQNISVLNADMHNLKTMSGRTTEVLTKTLALLPNHNVATHCLRKVQKIDNVVRVTQILREADISFAQWRKICGYIGDLHLDRKINRNRSMNNFALLCRREITLKHVDCIVESHLEDVLLLDETVRSEKVLQERFSQLTKPWMTLQINFYLRSVTPCFSIKSVGNVQEIVESIQNSLIELGTLLSQPFSEVVMMVGEKHKVDLEELGSVLASIAKIESFICRQAKIFYFEAARAYAPVVYDQWQDCVIKWNNVIDHLPLMLPSKHDGSFSIFHNVDGRAEVCASVTTLSNLVSRVMWGVYKFADEMRADFSRFWFLEDDQVIAAISDSREPGALFDTHVARLFPNITKVGFTDGDKGNPIVISVSSMHDSLKFGRVIRMRRVGHNCFHTLESEIKKSIFEIVIKKLPEDLKTLASAESIKSDVPSQIIISLASNWFTKEVNRTMMDSVSVPCTGLAQIIDNIDEVLLSLDYLLRKSHEDFLSPRNWNRIGKLQFHLLQEKHTLDCLIKENVIHKTDFSWFGQPKTFINMGGSEKTLTWSVSCCEVKEDYGYEYVGDTSQTFVFSSNSDRYMYGFMKLFGSGHGGMLFDDDATLTYSSTIVETFASVLGKLHFKRSPNVLTRKDTIVRLLKGCILSGACLQFEGLTRCTVSDLQLIASFFSVIASTCKTKSAPTMIQDSQIKISRSYCFVCTISTKLHHRISPSLNSAFAKTFLVLPKLSAVINMSLAKIGIYNKTNLIASIEREVYSEIGDDLEKRYQTVIAVVKKLSRRLKDGTITFVDDGNVLTEAMVSNETKTVQKIRELYSNSTIFPKQFLSCEDDVVELYQRLVHYKAVALIGPSCSGKTSLQNALYEILCKIHETSLTSKEEHSLDSEILFPKSRKSTLSHFRFRDAFIARRVYFLESMPLNLLYGGLSDGHADGRYIDGLISYEKHRRRHDLCNNIAKETWIILDGDADAAVLELFSSYFGIGNANFSFENRMNLIPRSCSQYLILETITVEHLSPLYAALFSPKLCTNRNETSDTHLEIWCFEKLSQYKSADASVRDSKCVCIEKLKKLYQLSTHIKTVHSDICASRVPYIFSLYKCLRISDSLLAAIPEKFFKEKSDFFAKKIYCTSLIWGLGGELNDTTLASNFCEYMTKVIIELKLDQEKGFDISNVEEDPRQLFDAHVFLPTSNVEVMEYVIKDGRNDFIIVLDKFKRNTLKIAAIVTQCGYHTQLFGNDLIALKETFHYFANLEGKVLSYFEHVKVKKAYISYHEDLCEAIKSNFDRHNDITYSGFHEDSILLFIDDFHIDERDVRAVLRSFVSSSGFYDPETLIFSEVNRFAVALCTLQRHSASKNYLRLLKHFLPLYIGENNLENAKNLFEMNIKSKIYSKNISDAFSTLVSPLLHSTKNFHINFFKNSDLDFFNEGNAEQILVRSLREVRMSVMRNKRDDFQSFAYDWIASLSLVYGPLLGSLPKRMFHKTMHFFPALSYSKMQQSVAAVEANSEEADYLSRREYGRQFLEKKSPRSYVSMSPYIISISNHLLEQTEILAITLVKHDILLLTKENQVSFEYLVNSACVSMEKTKVHTAALGPMSLEDIEEIILASLAYAFIDALKDDVDIVILSIINGQFIEENLLHCLYRSLHGCNSKILSGRNIVEFIKDTLGQSTELDIDSIESQTKSLLKIRLVLQMPYSQKTIFSHWKHCRLFDLFKVICVPKLGPMCKREIVGTIIGQRLGKVVSLEDLETLSDMFINLDAEMIKRGKDNLLLLLESVDAFVTKYPRSLNGFFNARKRILAALEEIIRADETMANISSQIYDTQENLKASIDNISHCSKTISSLKDELSAYESADVIEKEMLKTIESAFLNETINVKKVLHDKKAIYIASIETIRSLEKSLFVDFARLPNPTEIEKKVMTILLMLFDVEAPHDWRVARNLLLDPRFQSKLIRLKPSDLTSHTLDLIRNALVELKNKACTSVVAERLLRHAKIIVKFLELSNVDKPLSSRKDMLRAEVFRQLESISKLTSSIENIKLTIERHEKELSQQQSCRNRLSAKLASLKSDYSWCKKSFLWLNMKSSKWKVHLENLKTVKIPSAIGHSFIAFACLAYACSLSEDDREMLRVCMITLCNGSSNGTMNVMSDITFGGITEIDEHDFESVGILSSVASCTIALDILNLTGITVLLDPNQLAVHYLQSAFEEKNVLTTFTNDPKLASKLNRALHEDLVLIVNCGKGDLLPSSIWYFLYHDCGLEDMDQHCNEQSMQIRKGNFRIFIRSERLPDWFGDCCHYGMLINFGNTKPVSTRDKGRQNILISISRDMHEINQTEEKILSLLASNSLSTLCKLETFQKSIDHILTTEGFLEDRLSASRDLLAGMKKNREDRSLCSPVPSSFHKHCLEGKHISVVSVSWNEGWPCTADQVAMWVTAQLNIECSEEIILSSYNDTVVRARQFDDYNSISGAAFTVIPYRSCNEQDSNMHRLYQFNAYVKLGESLDECLSCFSTQEIQSSFDMNSLKERRRRRITKYSENTVSTRKRTRISIQEKLRHTRSTRGIHDPRNVTHKTIALNRRLVIVQIIDERFQGVLSGQVLLYKKVVGYAIAVSLVNCFRQQKPIHEDVSCAEDRSYDHCIWSFIIHFVHWNLMTVHFSKFNKCQINTFKVMQHIRDMGVSYIEAFRGKMPVLLVASMVEILRKWSAWYSPEESFYCFFVNLVSRVIAEVKSEINNSDGKYYAVKRNLFRKFSNEILSVLSKDELTKGIFAFDLQHWVDEVL